MLLSTDIGGTFTDFVLFDKGRITAFKVPSTPHEPELAIRHGLCRCAAAPLFSHGTTLATNAVLERKGAKLGLLTTSGFADILRIGRQQRSQLYQLDAGRPRQLVEPPACIEIAERVSASGEVLQSPRPAELRAVAERLRAQGIESVAICFLFSFLNPANELQVRDYLVEEGFTVSCSSEVLPEFREYERMSTTVLDAYLKRTVERYLSRLELILAEHGVEQFYVLQSNGGVVKAVQMQSRPVTMLLSGPAGGVAAAQYLSAQLGVEHLITFDMGGTSADVSAIRNGQTSWTSEGELTGLPIRLPMVDIATVGAGGGSIAWLDAGGALRVGPESAGAVPGPICYDLGGKNVTVTDCDLLCGYLNPRYFVGGELPLDAAKARGRVEQFAEAVGLSCEDTILGVWKIVNATMLRALRVVSVERGLDVRDFTLCAFGGAGPVHAAALAEELGIPRVIVPFAAGVFSAFGILVSDIQLDYSRTQLLRLPDGQPEAAKAERIVQETLTEFAARARQELAVQELEPGEAIFRHSVDMRYAGQSYELNVPYTTLADAQRRFHEQHAQRYGYAMPAERVELVTIRMRAVVPREKPALPRASTTAEGTPIEHRTVLFEDGKVETPVYRREDLPAQFEHDGAAIIEAKDCTVVVPPGMRFTVDAYGDILIVT